MRLLNVALTLGLTALTQGPPAAPAPSSRPQTRPSPAPTPGVRLAELAWTEAERHLRPDAVIVLPLGAAAKEHGPHLQLRNDLTLADYLTGRVLAASPVVVAPALTYHFYPAFLEYPGSTSLTFAVARDMTVEIVRTLARSGPRRFYVLNTGISTLRPLEAAAKVLAGEGILLRYTDLEARSEAAVRAVRQQAGGTHADEIETSMMLYIDPSVVDMTKAVSDYAPAPAGPLRLTRQPGGPGTYSRTGIWGDPTLATREKGRVIVEALLAGILGDIDDIRRAAPPQASQTAAEPSRHPEPAGRGAGPVGPDGCSGGDERTIRGIGPAFTLAWTNQDAWALGGLWSGEGDIVHPDGSVERTQPVIRQNRAYLFTRQEYRASRHFLAIGQVRCLSTDVAVADGKWELRDVVDANRQTVPPMDGLSTLVLRRRVGGWGIEAYRYTVTPRRGAAPTLLKRPGFIDR